MGTAFIIVLVIAATVVYASRVGLPGRPRRLNVAKDQREFVEHLLPAAEEAARQRGMSEDEIAAKEQQIRDALPLAPADLPLEPDGTALDRQKHVL